jgi:signal transduction histidine kinase
MAKTVIADLTMAATQVASPERARATTGVEAAARQARLVAHEIRNALLPVKTSVTALYREVLINSPTEAIGKRRETIDRGIEEIFHFVDELVKVSALTAAPPEPFELGAVIRDSLSAVRFPTNINVEVDSALELPFVSGQRNRVVLAIVNILRNAVQHGNGKVLRINVHAEPIDGARAVRLTIEDDGPGVPEAMRQAIFTEGLSLRPGGSGLGLTLVREIFEKEMNGIISCDASPLGGARFIIRLPTSGTTR